MTPPFVTETDVGTYWLGPDGKVWTILLYCGQPTVTFARVDDQSIRKGGAVGAPITEGFIKLVPAKEEA